MTALEIPAALVIREPREAELPLCRMLLPEACASPIGRHFRLAFVPQPERVVAALSYRDDATALGGVRVHVIPTHRRSGIGARLLEYAAQEARRFGRGRMFADVDLHSEPEAEPFLKSQGFHKVGTITSAEIGIKDLRANMEANRERLETGMKNLPPSARFGGLSDAPIQEVTRLYAEHINHMQAVAGMRETLRLERATDSVALLIDGKLAAFVLARLDEGVLHIPAWVVAPELRGQGMGFALLNELGKRVRGRVERLHFEFTDAAMETPKMLSVPGCQITKMAARFERVIPV